MVMLMIVMVLQICTAYYPLLTILLHHLTLLVLKSDFFGS